MTWPATPLAIIKGEYCGWDQPLLADHKLQFETTGARHNLFVFKLRSKLRSSTDEYFGHVWCIDSEHDTLSILVPTVLVRIIYTGRLW